MSCPGSTAPGFEAVADAFADVMAGSAGAFTVVRGGETLVELYTGQDRAPDGRAGARTESPGDRIGGQAGDRDRLRPDGRGRTRGPDGGRPGGDGGQAGARDQLRPDGRGRTEGPDGGRPTDNGPGGNGPGGNGPGGNGPGGNGPGGNGPGGNAAPRGGDWDAATVAVLFSGTKGLAATACAALAGPAPHGLDPDEPVARYWPEFAACGKGSVTVGQALSHTAGLPYVDPAPGTVASDLDDRAGAAALARQAPVWEPGSRVAYHALTWGHLVAELLRRVTGRDPRAVVEAVAARVPGVRVFLRTPPQLPARIVRAPGYRLSTFLHDDPGRRAVVDRMYRVLGDPEMVNAPAWYRSGALAGAGVAGATSMARLYAALADKALSPVPPAALARATTVHAEGLDAINDRPLRYGLGFELADPVGTYGPEPVAFGHSGAGGGRHGAWPERGIGFSFLPGELRAEDVDDRASTLLAALHRCL